MKTGNKYLFWTVGVALLLSASSCRYHTQHYMFRSEKSLLKSDSSLFEYSENNYILQVNDWLELEVYTNNGELLIDPNYELKSAIMAGTGQRTLKEAEEKYLVLKDGTVRFPMIGYVKVDERSIIDVEMELQKRYKDFYVDPYVRIKPMNRRIILFSGKGGQVIKMEHENMNLLEILALGGEIATGSNSSEIKIIRGDLRDPELLLVDLSTIEGMTKANLKVLPNDIVYVQAKRNRVREVIQDVSPLLTFTSSLALLVITVANIIK